MLICICVTMELMMELSLIFSETIWWKSQRDMQNLQNLQPLQKSILHSISIIVWSTNFIAFFTICALQMILCTHEIHRW